MVLERTKLWCPRAWWGHLTTMVIVMLLWVPFRTPDMATTVQLWSAMLGWGIPFVENTTLWLFEPKNVAIMLCGVGITMMPQTWFRYITWRIARYPVIQASGIFGLFLLAIITLIDRGFTPFIYANF